MNRRRYLQNGVCFSLKEKKLLQKCFKTKPIDVKIKKNKNTRCPLQCPVSPPLVFTSIVGVYQSD